MYRLEIKGSFIGIYKTPAEAMAVVDKLARPFRYNWVILDQFGRIYARG